MSTPLERALMGSRWRPTRPPTDTDIERVLGMEFGDLEVADLVALLERAFA